MTTPTTARGGRTAPDAVCAEAVELARTAALDEGGHRVGDHLGVEAEGERLVAHSFACTDPGYVGWRWVVTVARASRSRTATVDEVVLLPGDGALLAPPWVPWSERLRPGDLGVGDLLPPDPDDDRLVPAYADPAEEPFEAHWELGMGRPRVLSLVGREEAAERWYEGDAGPDAPIARAAPAPCGTCGFLVPLAGGLRSLFGACANAFAPDDGRVVSLDHGCGAHSETVVDVPVVVQQPTVVDEYGYDLIEAGTRADLHEGAAGTGPAEAGAADPHHGGVPHPPGSVGDTEPAEDLGHS